MGLKEDMDKAVCMAGKMEFEYKLRVVIVPILMAVITILSSSMSILSIRLFLLCDDSESDFLKHLATLCTAA